MVRFRSKRGNKFAVSPGNVSALYSVSDEQGVRKALTGSSVVSSMSIKSSCQRQLCMCALENAKSSVAGNPQHRHPSCPTRDSKRAQSERCARTERLENGRVHPTTGHSRSQRRCFLASDPGAYGG